MTTPNTATPTKGFLFSDKLYTKAKWATMILLPALSTLYFTLGTIWEFPNVEQVVGTIAALATFLGILLGLSTKAYNASDARYAGAIDVATNDVGTKVFTLALNGDPEELEMLPEVTFKVNTPS